jgi:RHS repeat-associated protein
MGSNQLRSSLLKRPAPSANPRTAGQGYVADNVRQKFTQKERDNESGLDYFGARYYSSPQGRFTSPDPLLSSGRIYGPQTWNRYSYTLNNPLKYVDPSGLYEFDSSVSQKDRDRFQRALTDLGKARDSYQKSGDKKKYEALDKAFKAYGTLNDGNGVTIAVGKVTQGAAAETSFGRDGQGHPLLSKESNGTYVANVIVTFRSSGKIDLDNLGHEGSHVEDHQNFISALVSASKNVGDHVKT